MATVTTNWLARATVLWALPGASRLVHTVTSGHFYPLPFGEVITEVGVIQGAGILPHHVCAQGRNTAWESEPKVRQTTSSLWAGSLP